MTTIDKCTYGNWIAGKEISAELKILQVLIVKVSNFASYIIEKTIAWYIAPPPSKEPA